MSLSIQTKAIFRTDQLLSRIEPYYIIQAYRGSIAHGTYESKTTNDDKDLMNIFVAPESVIFGIERMETIERTFEEQISQKKIIQWDIVCYTLQKFIELLLKQNPNVLMLLWLDKKHYIDVHPLGEILIENRHKFMSKRMYNSFSGYAYSQLHRMTHHAPTDRMGAKRKELIEKFGYDVKNASHLIRLLKQGIEALSTGELQVERPDAQMLLEIKRGEWKKDDVLKYAESLFPKLLDALNNSRLPARPDHHFVNEVCMAIHKEFYKVMK